MTEAARLVLKCCFLALLAVSSWGGHAHADSWVLLGSRSPDLTAGRDQFDMSRVAGAFKAIRLEAKDRSVKVARIVVTFSSGERHVEARTINLLAGERTAPIASGAERFVNTVEVTYGTGAGGADRSGTLEIWGLQSPEGARATRGAAPTIASRPGASGGSSDITGKKQSDGEARSAQDQITSRRSFEAARPAPSAPATRAATPRDDAAKSAPPPPPAEPPAATRSRSVTAAPPPPAPAPQASTRGIAPPPTAASADKLPYATVPVLFGTDRKQGTDRKAKWGDTVATFGADSQFKLALGKALVTVPTKEGVRQRGSVPRPELIVFGFRVPWGEEQLDKHFTVYSARALDEAAFIAEVKQSLGKSKSFEKHAFLFVHGYNVNFEDSLYRTAQIAHDLEFDGAAFMYSWPSKGDPKAYLLDEDRAKGARPYLREMLELIAAKADVEHLHIVAHSKGAELVVEVLNSMSTMSDVRKKLRINEIILAAPDIDRANFEQIAERIVGVASRGVTLYASNNDKALGLSNTFRLGSVRAGEVPADRGPVLIKGMDTIDISAANTDFFSSNHITFAERQSLILDMRSILRTGQHPPDQRSGVIFTPVTTTLGKYWKYVK